MDTTPNDLKVYVRQYAEYPGPRYCDQGDFSGEDFYHSILNPEFAKAYDSKGKLVVDLDGTAGYASSFLDEAFGNLVFDFSAGIVRNHLVIISKQEPDWKELILNEVLSDWDQRRAKKQSPKKTEVHKSWVRIDDKGITQPKK